MAGVFRILLRIAIGSIALVVCAVVVAYYLAARSLPDYDAKLELPGALGKIEVVRDTANVPHIFADQDADVFFGLGYVHAQDRLWQMSMMRRTAQGRLSKSLVQILFILIPICGILIFIRLPCAAFRCNPRNACRIKRLCAWGERAFA